MSVRPEQPVGLNAAVLTTAGEPLYPPLAKLARQQGVVKFQAMVAKDGTIRELKVTSGPPLLVQSATQAVKAWIYQPAMWSGSPVETVTNIDVKFTLAGDVPPQ
jgi:protein TonB